MRRAIVPGVILLLIAAAWLFRAELLRLVPTPLLPVPAHGQYAAALVITGLADTDAGRAWSAAADRALEDPVEAALQHERSAAFTGAPDEVVSWQFGARRGQRVTIDVGDVEDTVFLDLFDADRGTRVASAPPGTSQLSHIVEDDGELIARLQLPLSGAGSFPITQEAEASLLFPVQGLNSRAVQSGFGASRDSGARSHEGIDIFAPRGTPVVAAADGWITQQTTNRLGGNVVWLWVPGSRASLYYAHLDSQAVQPGERVQAGEVLGYVGNTGNARGTSPHLHFGVYASLEGAVDPLPYVVDPDMHRDRRETRTRQ